MAKPKHPNLKTLKQGQTVFCVEDRSLLIGRPAPKEVKAYFLHSQKTPPQPVGEIIERLPVSIIRRAIRLHGKSVVNNFYYSRRRAETAARI